MSKAIWDVVVVGGGMAGLSAALAVAERGRTVLVVEKRSICGGNASISAGAIWTISDYHHFREYVPEGNPELQQLLAEGLNPALNWLEALGLPLTTTISVAGLGEGRAMDGGTSGHNAPFMECLAHQVEELGGAMQYQSSLRSLRHTGDHITLDLLRNGSIRTEQVAAKSVVLATGGFQGNRDLLERWLGSQAAHLRIRSIPECTGDGLLAALAVGAATAGDMTSFYGHTMPDAPIPYDEMQPVTPYFARFGLLLNRNGCRFVDENGGHLEELNPQEGFRQPGGVYYLVFDESIYREYAFDQRVTPSIPSFDRVTRAMELGAPVFTAPTLAALAIQLGAEGLPPHHVLSEIEGYNLACETRTSHLLKPPRTRNAIPLTTPPFYAMRCAGAISNPSGGIATDVRGRVLTADGQPIEGMFAAGADAGGVFQRYYAGGLAWALVSGRTAGCSAAERK